MKTNRIKFKFLLILGILGIAAFAGGVFASQLIEEKLNEEIENSLILPKPSDSEYQNWLSNTDDLDPPIYRSYYMWNLTNPAEFLMGEIPILDEIGPFVFREFENKVNVTFSNDYEFVSYSTQTFYVFQPELSTDDPLTTYITNINLGYQGILNEIGSEATLLLLLTSGIFNELVSSLTNDFVEQFIMMSAPIIMNSTKSELSSSLSLEGFYEQWANGTLISNGIDIDGDSTSDIFLGEQSNLEINQVDAIFSSSNSYGLTNSTGVGSWMSSNDNKTLQDSIISQFNLTELQYQLIIAWLNHWLELVIPNILIDQLSPFGVTTIQQIGLLQWGSSALTNGTSIFEFDQSLNGYPEIWAFLKFVKKNLYNFDIDTIELLLQGESALSNPQNLGLFMQSFALQDFSLLANIWNVSINEATYINQYFEYLTQQFTTPMILDLFDQGGGMIRSMTVDEWLFSGVDPLLLIFAPDNADISLFNNQTKGSDPSIDAAHTFYTGISDVNLAGIFVKNQGKEVIDVWKEPVIVQGSNGEQFGPHISEDSQLVAWSADVLRPIQFEFLENVEKYSIEMLRFTLASSVFASSNVEPNNEKFYQTIDGLFNMSIVTGLPIFLSNPHFLNGDPILQTGIIGFQPDKLLHETYIDVEPLTGAVMNAAQRLQFNIQIKSTDLFFQNLPKIIFPILWAEKTGSISESLANEYLNGITLAEKYMNISKFSGGIIGLILLIGALKIGIKSKD